MITLKSFPSPCQEFYNSITMPRICSDMCVSINENGNLIALFALIEIIYFVLIKLSSLTKYAHVCKWVVALHNNETGIFAMGKHHYL